MVSWPSKLATFEVLSEVLGQSTLSVGTTPVKVTPQYQNTRILILYNEDGQHEVYMGNSLVTTSDGIPIPPKSLAVFLISGDPGIHLVSSGIVTVRILEGI